jgi:hypothetical protein
VASARDGSAPVDACLNAASRLDVVVYDLPVNKLNRSAELLGRESLVAEA